MIIGRKREQEILQNCLISDKSELVVIYGRRRVGKTYLVREYFKDKLTFYSTGVLGGDRETQLRIWNDELAGIGGLSYSYADNWFDAFRNLRLFIEEKLSDKKHTNRSDGEKTTIFLDELPWMATRNSDFIPALDYFWNRWASSRKDIVLIICGSATSWMTDKIINNKGGLHNRMTQSILMKPFTLCECEEYYRHYLIPLTRYQIAEAYMVFGGIPYYMSLFESKYSLYQNIDNIYFASDAKLQNEFDNLFRSLYSNAEHYIDVVEALAQKGIGLSRSDIVSALKTTDGGGLTRILKDLESSGFIRKYKSYGQKKRDSLYQLVDFFSMFDVRFRDKREDYAGDFWLSFSSTVAYSVWSGFCFEKVCLYHISEIRQKLSILGVLTAIYAWRGKHENNGVQIDLILDRNDNIVNVCEMKFSSGLYTIDKKHSDAIRNKRVAFASFVGAKKSVQTTMITTYGLKPNMYSAEITSQVTLDDFF